MKDSLLRIEKQVVICTRCARLVEYRRRVAQEKRKAYRDWKYWGKPIPGFGDPQARLLILGLAPAAHGGNRTGRVFTGDRSGDFLFGALYRTGFANQPTSVRRDDGLQLHDAYVTAAVRCVPPGNKPSPEEFRNCREYLERELALLGKIKVVVALGKLAFDSYLSILRDRGWIRSRSGFRFSHGALYVFTPPEKSKQLGNLRTSLRLLPQNLPTLIASYHPSQQNTQTGKLSAEMLEAVFRKARDILHGSCAVSENPLGTSDPYRGS